MLKHKALKCSQGLQLCTFRNYSSTFDINKVTNDYERRTGFAAANYRKNGSIFRMTLPPPNVTGKLHLGHALTVSIEDAICRHERSQGNKAEWIPGFDHAGIATQAVVEKILLKNGIRRQDMTREEFIAECYKWSDKCSHEIRQQLTRLGASLDWKQSYYTFDKEFSSAVTRAFCTLHRDQLIFRGKRIVHWCPSLGSTLSTQEVNRIDVPCDGILSIPGIAGRRNVVLGKMHLVKYKLVDNEMDFIEVGTTRPETIFADIAIAVNPNDERYSKFIGKYAYSPLISNRKLLVIADSAVKINKGTGAVKITPSHDPLDYEIYCRHKKLMSNPCEISCIDENGKMINSVPQIDGMDRFEAREEVLQILAQKNLYSGTIKHENSQVNVCSRTGDIIEPRLTEQWYLDCKEIFGNSIKAIQNGEIKIYPEYQEHRILDWFENKEPWCLSRQLLWGHRIPAFRNSNSDTWVVCENEQQAFEQLGPSAIQDVDVLDTWFSSSLVPLVKNGWLTNEPVQNPSLNIMETGWDISGFWVARMIAMNMRLSKGQIPFSRVVLHGLVRDNEGRKMSKSLGNVIDPIDVLDGISLNEMIERIKKSALSNLEIENAIANLSKRFPNGIEKCGPDALRFALLRYDVLQMDISLDISNSAMEGLRFCNKLWNLAAYYDELAAKCDVIKDVDTNSLVDEWIMARLSTTISQVDAHMKNFSLHLALSTIHQFITSDICDFYLETTKKALWSDDYGRIMEARSTLQRVLQPTFVQLSSFMPFVCEYLYERIFSREPGSINFDVVKPSLFIFHQNPELEQGMEIMRAVMASIRSLRQKLELSQKIVFEGVLELEEEIELSAKDLKRLADEVTHICGLKLENIRKKKSEGDFGVEYVACPIPGKNAKLWVKIGEESRNAFKEALRNQLEKTRNRRDQFLKKVESYEEICNNPTTKLSSVEKNRRKAVNAKKVVENANKEIERIQILIVNQE